MTSQLLIMPYPFAYPAAAAPAPLMGRSALPRSPSAASRRTCGTSSFLSSASRAIASPGSPTSPAGGVALSAVPSILKQPLIALLSPRPRIYTGAPAGGAVARGADLAARRRAHPCVAWTLGHSHDAGWRQLAAAPEPPAAAWCWAGGSGASCGARPRRRGALSPARRHPARARRHRRARRAARGGAASPDPCAAPIFSAPGGLAALEALGAALLVWSASSFSVRWSGAPADGAVEITRGVAGEMFAFYRESRAPRI